MEDQHFSFFKICGIIMLCVFLFPFVLRPKDVLFNCKGYFVGVTVYILMLPAFISVMSIYAMCNLHDLSWGNRPSVSSGAE